MYMPRSMFQFAVVSFTLIVLIVLFLSSHTGPGALEHGVASKYMRFDRSRAPPPYFNNAQLKVAINEPTDDPIWDTQNSTLGVRNTRTSYRDSD
jgi:hypothetical protein